LVAKLAVLAPLAFNALTASIASLAVPFVFASIVLGSLFLFKVPDAILLASIPVRLPPDPLKLSAVTVPLMVTLVSDLK
jgi:hypothetical protein